MKRTTLILGILFSFSTFFYSCGSSEETESNTEEQEIVDDMELTSSEADELEETNTGNEDEIRNFLYSTEGTYGWKSTQEEFFYDFMQDGRLHIEGAEGESTMWEGKWSLSGSDLTLENPDEDLMETVTVKIEGANLIIGGVAYERYKP